MVFTHNDKFSWFFKTLILVVAVWSTLIHAQNNIVFIDNFDGTSVGGPSIQKILETSPRNGETGIAVTRETIIRFPDPLAASTTINNNVLFAEFAGQRLGARIHVSSDRKTVTLFYSDDLPASARVRVTLRGDNLIDTTGAAVDVDNDGQPGGTAFIDFDTLSLTTLPNTVVCGRVFASELQSGDNNTSVNVPLEGVRITVDGAENTLFATTDSMGDFCLDPAPAERFFVHIDGRTATNGIPQGAYYPFVGKPFEPIPGQEVNIGDIYLPLIQDDTLQSVSASSDTEIKMAQSVLNEFPEFGDVSITVPANSLFADDGTRGGRVGISPVPPDRLPGPLPDGLNFPIVITVQTDGPTNFDVPAPVCFPNLPDPDTNEILPAGAKSALWSFNHDTGDWEPVGSGTVTSDARMICSDAESGILAPGWHGFDPLTWLENIPDWIEDFLPRCEFSDPFNCGATAAAGALFCVLSIYTPADCAIRGTLAGISAARPCLNSLVGTQSFDSDCISSVVVSGAGAGLGCYLKVPGISQAITCGNGVINAAEACGCSFSGKTSFPFHIYADLNKAAARKFPATTKLDSHIRILESYRRLSNVVFGSAVWTSPSENLFDSAQPVNQIQIILERVFQASNRNSQGGESITSSEANNIKNLARPSEIKITDIDLLISYFNTTVSMWQLGKSTHQEAGRADFIDSGQLLSALGELESILQEIEENEFTTYNLGKSLQDVETEFLTRISSPTTIPTTLSLGFFSINRSSSTIFRGRLSSSGNVPRVALRPNRSHSIKVFDRTTFRTGELNFVSADAGEPTRIGPLVLNTDSDMDSDFDTISNKSENIIGTNPNAFDTDSDGTSDGVEIRNGTNPLDGLPVQTGIIGTTNTPGTATDVCAFNDYIAVADGSAGVSVFNIFNGMEPTIIAQINTPGDADAIACGRNRIAVADGTSGIAVIDISDPPAAQIISQVTTGELIGDAESVAIAGDQVFVGTIRGIVAIDLDGSIYQRVDLGERVHDLSIDGKILYALTDTTLHTLSIDNTGPVQQLGSTASPGGTNTSNGRKRLFVGGGIAYAVNSTHYNTLNVSNPAAPLLVASEGTNQFGWKHIVTTGSGLGIAAVSPNQGFDGPHHVSLYDTSDPSTNDAFITQFETPGIARAIVLYNGLAYVADNDAGMQIVNYLAADTGSIAPTVSFASDIQGNAVESRSLVFVDVDASDDVQVRNVELLIDGEVVQTDGNFPYQFFFNAPALENQNSFTLAVRATDTGGNSTTTNEILVSLTPDVTPPFVISSAPQDGQSGLDVDTVSFRFNEAIDSTTLTTAGVTLIDFGPDNQLGGGDDQTIAVAGISAPDERRVTVELGSALPEGNYRLTLSRTIIEDLSGNAMAADETLRFASLDSTKAGTINWITLGNGDWNNPVNWDLGRIPNISDDVAIRIPGSNVNVTHANGDTTVGSLRLNGSLQLSGGAITVTQGASTISGNLEASPAVSFSARGNGTTFTVTQPSQLDEANLSASTGAVITVPVDGEYNIEGAGAGSSTFRASGSGSRITLPGLTSVFNNTRRGDGLIVEVDSGGQIALPDATRLVGREDNDFSGIRMVADGQDSVINVSSMTSFSQGSMISKNGGTIQSTNLTSLRRASFERDAFSIMPSEQISALIGSTIFINGHTTTLPNLSSIDDSGFVSNNGGVIIVQGSDINYTITGISVVETAFRATGPGSKVVLENLTSIFNDTRRGSRVRIGAVSGGRVEFPELLDLLLRPDNDFTGIEILADGPNSVIDMPKLSNVFGDAISFSEQNGGQILRP